MCGIDPSEAVVFFGAQAQAMLDCPPNYGPKSKKVTTAKNHQLRVDVWLMRGFFPETPQMFKISISPSDSYQYEYYVKVSEPKINTPSKKIAKGKYASAGSTSYSHFDYATIKQQYQDRMEKEVLGIDLNINSIVQSKEVFTPKCISPKGMNVFKLTYKKA